MGFLLFLKLVATISDVLAWPLITLVYPLYASIRAIERNSLSDSKKCLTYWVICGLIMLFEIPFAWLVEWIPFWPYVKLMFNLWCVAAYFDGAVYAYDHFIRPCFSVNLQTVGYWLRPKRNEFDTGNSDSFLLLAQRFVQENGSDELEKLILDSNKVKCLHPKLATGENNLISFVDNKEITEETRIKCEEPKLDKETEEKKLVDSVDNIENNTDRKRVEMMMSKSLVQISEHKAIATTENRPTAEAKLVVESSGVPQSPIASNTQKEWTCALCQVCVTSEIILKNHLQGRKHKAKEELIIKKSTQTENGAKPSSGKTQNEKAISAKDMAAQKIPSHINNKSVDISETNSTKGEVAKSCILEEPLKKWKCHVCQIYLLNEVSIQDHVQGKGHKANKEMEDIAKQLVDIKFINNTGSDSAASTTVKLSYLWCEKCKLKCNSLSMLTDHLRGKKHLKDSSL